MSTPKPDEVEKLCRKIYRIGAPAYKKACGREMFKWDVASEGSKAATKAVAKWLLTKGVK